eukprot:365252-Chlamydomonas_euryale.AAC.13
MLGTPLPSLALAWRAARFRCCAALWAAEGSITTPGLGLLTPGAFAAGDGLSVDGCTGPARLGGLGDNARCSPCCAVSPATRVRCALGLAGTPLRSLAFTVSPSAARAEHRLAAERAVGLQHSKGLSSSSCALLKTMRLSSGVAWSGSACKGSMEHRPGCPMAGQCGRPGSCSSSSPATV